MATPVSRLDSIEEIRLALLRHREGSSDWSVTSSIPGLIHLLERAQAALRSEKPGDPAVGALREELAQHSTAFQLAGMQLEVWRSDFVSRNAAVPGETYEADARLKQQTSGRILAEA